MSTSRMQARDGVVVLTDCRLIDGAGNPWVRADLLLDRGRVAEIAPPGALRRRRRRRPADVIDAGGRYVTPGFIDPHTHSDLTVLACPGAESAVFQGVTTHIVGNCGMSPAPLDPAALPDLVTLWEQYFDTSAVAWDWRTYGEYLDVVESAGCAINVGGLVGHGALRVAVMGFAQRAATARELAAMRRLTRQSMAGGALGLSTGLVYPPGCYAPTEELVELVRAVSEFDGIYASHIRGERETILEAVAEAIAIGAAAGTPVEVSHNAPKWGGPPASENLELIEDARRRGQDVTLDNDTHTDLAPRLSRALPQSLHDLDADALVERLRDPDVRAELRRQVTADDVPGAGYVGLLKHGDYARVFVLSAPDASLLGRSVADIAAQRGVDPLETYLDLIVESGDEIVGIFDYIDQAQIEAVITHPLAMVCSDGLVLPLPKSKKDTAYWPCSYGEYTGLLERFVRDREVLRLEEAIRKMTSAPAQRFGLWDRGVLRPGARADVVVFDLERVRDRATNPYPHSFPFENIPPRYSEGMDYVFVNGEAVVYDGAHTGARSGHVLRRAVARRRHPPAVAAHPPG